MGNVVTGFASRFACLVLLGVSSLAFGTESYDLDAALDLADDPIELERTWQQAWIHLPASEAPPGHLPVIGPLGSSYVRNRLKSLPAAMKRPTVVFLHGCAGIQAPERRLEKILTRMGYAVIFPDSKARSFRPNDCNVKTGERGLFPPVNLYRRAELLHTMTRVRELAWVDEGNLFLGGFGEGANAVALWGGNVEVTGFIVTGWTCATEPGRERSGGIRTPLNRPVLMVVTSNDPYYGWVETEEDCGGVWHQPRNGTSLVIDGTVHNVFVYPETSWWLVNFMLAHTRSSVVPSNAFLDLEQRMRAGPGSHPLLIYEALPDWSTSSGATPVW